RERGLSRRRRTARDARAVRGRPQRQLVERARAACAPVSRATLAPTACCPYDFPRRAAPPRIQRGSAMHILVVEDHRDIATSIVEFLGEQGHAVDVALDGVTGLHLGTVNDYDALVLDIGLPGID